MMGMYFAFALLFIAAAFTFALIWTAETAKGDDDLDDYDEHWYGVTCYKCKHDYLYSTRFERFVGKWAHAITHPRHTIRLSNCEVWNDADECSPDYSHYLDDTTATGDNSDT